jgi:hypothetical protein
MYACCPPEYRLGFTHPQCAWALTSQEPGTSENFSYLFRMGPIRPIEQVYDDFLYVHNLTREHYWEHIKEIGGIPFSDYYIVCSDKIECENHIIQCQNCTTRQLLRKNYLGNLRSLLEHNGISESVSRVMISNLSSWFNNTPYIPLPQLLDQDEESVIKAATEQMEIGWEHWFYGRIARSWGEITTSTVTNNNNCPEKWGKEIILLTWEFVVDAWIARNQAEYSKEGDGQKRQKDKLISQILWYQKNNIRNNGTSMYNEINEETLRHQPIDNLQMMITQMKIIGGRESFLSVTPVT